MKSEFRGQGYSAVTAAVFKNNAKQRDVPALKPERYTILGVIEVVLAQTNNLIIRFFPSSVQYNFVFFTFQVFLYKTNHNVEVVSFQFNLYLIKAEYSAFKLFKFRVKILHISNKN